MIFMTFGVNKLFHLLKWRLPKINFLYQHSSLYKSSISSLLIVENENKIDNSSNGYNSNERDELKDELKDEFREFVKMQNLNHSTVFVSDATGYDPLKESEYIKFAKSCKVFEFFGTPDQSQPVSNVTCHGCGALLHCKNPSVPGYMPSQIFLSVPLSQLKYINCQRCYILKANKFSLNSTVSYTNYNHVIKEIKKHSALILLLVDITDLSNSFHNSFKFLTSSKRPMFIIGNKADLLCKDVDGYMTRAKNVLIEISRKNGFIRKSNVEDFFLISSQTGFGIENLITKLLHFWRLKGNVFLVGTANSGKSTLFNALLASDFCRSSAKDVISRATTSIWPGTTFNLLKFPIMNPKPSKLYERYLRLKKQTSNPWHEDEETKKLNHKNIQPNLNNHLGSTFLNPSQMAIVSQSPQNVGFLTPTYTQSDDYLHILTGFKDAMNYLKIKPLPYDDSTFKYWCYDTPGLINPEQVINLLNQSELLLLANKGNMKPRIFILHVGQILLISGLARIDFLQGIDAIYIAIYTSSSIPLHVFDKAEHANDFYNLHVGTSVLGIPLGDSHRMKKLPSLVGAEFEIEIQSSKESAADVVLSSIGWIAICSGRKQNITLRAYTPGKKGLHLRKPALIQYPFENMGSRIKGTNEYKVMIVKADCNNIKKPNI